MFARTRRRAIGSRHKGCCSIATRSSPYSYRNNKVERAQRKFRQLTAYRLSYSAGKLLEGLCWSLALIPGGGWFIAKLNHRLKAEFQQRYKLPIF